jgi:hypothetical protein
VRGEGAFDLATGLLLPMEVGSWVALDDQVGQISKLDATGKCAVNIVYAAATPEPSMSVLPSAAWGRV